MKKQDYIPQWKLDIQWLKAERRLRYATDDEDREMWARAKQSLERVERSQRYMRETEQYRPAK